MQSEMSPGVWGTTQEIKLRGKEREIVVLIVCKIKSMK